MPKEEWGEWVRGQSRAVGGGGGHRLAGEALGEPASGGAGHAGKPDLAWRVIAPMAGIAGDAYIFDVLFPMRINVERHLDHAARHAFGIFRVGGEITSDMAIAAALFRCDPLRHRYHNAREGADRHVFQHLHVLIDRAGGRAGIGLRDGGRSLVGFKRGGDLMRRIFKLHAGAAITALDRDRGGVAEGEDGDHTESERADHAQERD